MLMLFVSLRRRLARFAAQRARRGVVVPQARLPVQLPLFLHLMSRICCLYSAGSPGSPRSAVPGEASSARKLAFLSSFAKRTSAEQIDFDD